MKIYFATTESLFFTDRSRLADFSYSLPKELSSLGHDVRVVMPLYSWIKRQYFDMLTFEKNFYILTNDVDKYVGIYSCEIEEVTYYFIDNEYYFSREAIDGYYDDAKRFGYFSRALMELLVEMKFYPDVIHLNDWHTAPSAAIFKDSYIQRKNLYNTKIVYTIHDVKKQGVFQRYLLKEALGLNKSYFAYDKLEYNGKINYMKGGIIFSDMVTTLSNTYANEIRHDTNVEGLQATLIDSAYKIIGIESGIDYTLYNPDVDNDIFIKYNKESIEQKAQNKEELQKMLGLRVGSDIPVIAYVGDIVNGKGVNLITFIFDELMEEDVEFIILGKGVVEYENEFLHFSHKYRYRVSTNIFYSDTIAKKIYAASDMLLMPSANERNGISQLIAMRYGCVPIVRNTGSLKDTVIKYDKSTGVGNGFVFNDYSAHELLFSIKDALHCYKSKEHWENIVIQAMNRDSSWKKTAYEYEKLYSKMKGE